MSAIPAGAGEVEIRSPRRLERTVADGVEYCAPVALNNDRDNGQVYTARRFWDCRSKCPDGACDHRTFEPVWDYRYVGGRVAGENDLLELELVAPRGAGAVLEVAAGAETVRLWPRPDKGTKGEILPARSVFKAGELPRKIYVEGIALGSAELRLSSDGGEAEAFTLLVDVFRLVESQGGRRRFIYDPKEIILALEPPETASSPAYGNGISWRGDASGSGPRVRVVYDPGEQSEKRRAVFRHQAVLPGGLVLEGAVKVRQNVFSGTPVAQTVPERRKEVESLLVMPKFGLMDTALPNGLGTQYSQAWFERTYTGASSPGDPVKPVNQARLQYAPLFDHQGGILGVACCYLKPYGVFISKLAYDAGLKREDLLGVATHEMRHLEHYSVMYQANGLWHVLCRYLDHKTASYYMEADGYSAAFQVPSTWRFLQDSAGSFVRNYREAVDATPKLPSLPQITSAINVLQSIYSRLPADMEEFKRPEYECFIRPPLEVDEKQ